LLNTNGLVKWLQIRGDKRSILDRVSLQHSNK